MAFPQKILKLTQDIGKAGLNALYPNDFEYYLVTLELADSMGNTVEYLTFPVSPESMSYDDQRLVNVKKTMAGVSSLDNETFNPKKIEMTGTFGRKFKLLLGNEMNDISLTSSEDSTAKGQFNAVKKNALNIKESVFDPRLKTGYGTTKILESIVEKSSSYDQHDKSYRLYLYNPALGHNWLVVVNSLNLSQDRTNSNMLWRYNLQLTAISPISKIKTIDIAGKSLSQATTIGSLQSGLNTLGGLIKTSIGNGITK